MGRKIAAVLAGVVAAGLGVWLFEWVGHQIYPPPEMTDVESIKAYMAEAPFGALVAVVVAWGLGSFLGGMVTAKIATSDHIRLGVIVGAIQMAFGIINLAMIPHPGWMWVAGILVFIPAAYLGAKLMAGGER